MALCHCFGEHLKAGVGYEFTDFSEGLTDLGYDHHGVFFDIIGSSEGSRPWIDSFEAWGPSTESRRALGSDPWRDDLVRAVTNALMSSHAPRSRSRPIR